MKDDRGDRVFFDGLAVYRRLMECRPRPAYGNGGELLKGQIKMAKTKMVRVTFELTADEAQRVCDIRCEPKPSTAAAQIVRLVLKQQPLKRIAEGV